MVATSNFNVGKARLCVTLAQHSIAKHRAFTYTYRLLRNEISVYFTAHAKTFIEKRFDLDIIYYTMCYQFIRFVNIHKTRLYFREYTPLDISADLN